MAKKEL